MLSRAAAGQRPSWRCHAVAAGVLFSSAGYFVNLPLVPLYLIHLSGGHASYTTAGFVVGVSFVVSAAVGPVWGRLADRFGAGSMMLRASAAITVVYLLMILCTSPAQLLGVRILSGFASGYIPAAGSLLSALVPESARGRAFSEFSIARSAGALAGPALGGLVAGAWGFHAAFAVAAVMSVAAGTIAVLVSRGAGAARSQTRQAAGAAKGVLGPAVRLMLAAVAVLAAATSALQFAVPLLLARMIRSQGAVSSATGALLAVCACVSIAMAYPWGMAIDRVGYRRLLPSVQAASAVVILLGVWAHRPWAVFVLVGGYTLLACELGSMFSVALLDRCAAGDRGRALGWVTTAAQLGAGAGPLVAGPLWTAGGSGTVFAALAASQLAVLALIMGAVTLRADRGAVQVPEAAR